MPERLALTISTSRLLVSWTPLHQTCVVNMTIILLVYFLFGVLMAVMFLYFSLLLWRQSLSKGSKNALNHMKLKVVTKDIYEDNKLKDETRKKVTILFGTQNKELWKDLPR
jgi:predicted membrane protein